MISVVSVGVLVLAALTALATPMDTWLSTCVDSAEGITTLVTDAMVFQTVGWSSMSVVCVVATVQAVSIAPANQTATELSMAAVCVVETVHAQGILVAAPVLAAL